MEGYGNSNRLIGAVILLLLLNSRQGAGALLPVKLFPYDRNSLSDLLGNLRLDQFASDVRRLADLMDQMSSLGQMTELMKMAGPLMAMLSGPGDNQND